MMVLEYAENDNLRKYLKNEFLNLTWKEKSQFLENIAYNLDTIHSQKYVEIYFDLKVIIQKLQI